LYGSTPMVIRTELAPAAAGRKSLGLVAGVDAVFKVEVIDHHTIGIGHLERHAVGGQVAPLVEGFFLGCDGVGHGPAGMPGGNPVGEGAHPRQGWARSASGQDPLAHRRQPDEVTGAAPVAAGAYAMFLHLEAGLAQASAEGLAGRRRPYRQESAGAKRAARG